MSKNILIPVDGSEHSLKALDFVTDIAARDSDSLYLVHVVPEHIMPQGLKQWAAVEHVNAPTGWIYGQAIADYILDSAADRAAVHGVSPVTKVTESGDAAKQIVEAANRHHADLIVMGTRGMGDLEGLFMGSVAHKVNQMAKCTVVTIR